MSWFSNCIENVLLPSQGQWDDVLQLDHNFWWWLVAEITNSCKLGDLLFAVYTMETILLFLSVARSLVRSSRPKVLLKIGVLKNFTKFTGKHLCQSLFFKKVAGVACNFIQKRLWQRCFPVNFAKFLGTPFSTEHLQGLLLLGIRNIDTKLKCNPN